MRYKRLFFAVISGTMLLSCRAWAQDDPVTTDASDLQGVLTTLKKSADQLSIENDQLALRNDAIKRQILQFQTQLGQMVSQGDVLNRTVDKLQDKNPRRSQQIAQLEDKNSDLDARMQKAEDGIALIQRSLGAGNMVRSPEDQLAGHRQKEKLKLMKMIYESEQRQEALHGSILEFQKNTPLLPAAGAMAHQQLLKEQIKDLQAQIAAYPPQKPSENLGPANQWDDAQLRQLEGDLKGLERNYSQLKNLMEQMIKKTQGSRMSVNEHIEGDKLQSSLDDLGRQGHGLVADLDELRSQMVDLDKRKSHLETMIQQMQ